jgi:hypothetical protein
MPITLNIKKQGGGMTMHIGDPNDKRGVFTPKGQKKPDNIKIPKKKGK